MEDNGFLTIVGVQELGNHMLAEYKTVFKALYSNIAQNIVVILVSGGHEAEGVAGIFLKLLVQEGIAHIFTNAEMAVTDIDPAYIL